MSDANGIPSGQQRAGLNWDEYSRLQFIVQQALAKMQTATLVKVAAVTSVGADAPVGLIDVQPLVNQLDGQGNPTPHVTIYNVPYLRIQGGANAIILDPQVGDIGICVFASRDISAVKLAKKQANPGSLRQYSFSDGMYLGGVLNGTPTQFVRFSPQGIEIKSPVAVKLEAPNVEIHAGTKFSWDVAGFGESWAFTGGTSWTHRLWQTGATVTTITGPISPPDGT